MTKMTSRKLWYEEALHIWLKEPVTRAGTVAVWWGRVAPVHGEASAWVPQDITDMTLSETVSLINRDWLPFTRLPNKSRKLNGKVWAVKVSLFSVIIVWVGLRRLVAKDSYPEGSVISWPAQVSSPRLPQVPIRRSNPGGRMKNPSPNSARTRPDDVLTTTQCTKAELNYHIRKERASLEGDHITIWMGR